MAKNFRKKAASVGRNGSKEIFNCMPLSGSELKECKFFKPGGRQGCEFLARPGGTEGTCRCRTEEDSEQVQPSSPTADAFNPGMYEPVDKSQSVVNVV